MSLFRIVGNYYEEMLEYLTVEYKRKYPTFDPRYLEKLLILHPDGNHSELITFKKNFYGLFDSREQFKKTELMQVLTSTFRKLGRIKESNLSYWKARENRFDTIRIMFILVLVIVTILILYICVLNIAKVIGKDGGTGNKTISIVRVVIGYVIIYTLLLCMFMLFILNARENKLMSQHIHNSHRIQFDQISVLLVPNIDLQKFLEALGYTTISDTKSADTIIKALVKQYNGGSSSSSESPTTTSCNTPEIIVIKDYIISKDPCKNKTDLHIIYDHLKKNIADYCFNFYNYGKGYTTLRGLITKTNSIYMLKEVRSILQFYYFLINKKGDEDIEKVTLQNKKTIIDTYIISKLQELNLDTFTKGSTDYENSIYDETNFEDPTIVDKYEAAKKQDDKFNVEMNNLDIAFNHLAHFLFPLYQKKHINDTSLPADLTLVLPQNLPDSKDVVKIDAKTYFTKKAQDRYNDLLAAVTMARDRKSIFSIIIQEFEDYITPYIKKALLKTKGDILLPIDRSYLKYRLTSTKLTDSEFNKNPYKKLPTEYKVLFIETILKGLMPTISKKILADIKTNGENFKVAMVANEIASDIVNYKIRVKDHITYIIDTLLEQNGGVIRKELVDIYKDILHRLDSSIEIKKNVRDINDKLNPRFIDSTEFTKRIDNIFINDFIDGLSFEYLQDLIKSYYSEVSTAIGSSNVIEPTNRTEFNIFYRKQRQMARTKQLINYATALIVEGYLLYLTSWATGIIYLANDFNKVYKDELDNRKHIILSKTYWFNTIVKLIIATLAMVFIIAMIHSYFRKGVAAFEFNRETVELNTSDLLSSVSLLNNQMNLLYSKTVNKQFTRIGDAPDDFTKDEKMDIYKKIVKIIESYEKCNYIINISQSTLPFPYTEITMDGFMVVMTLLTVFYVINKLKPIKRIQEIKELQKLKSKLAISSDKELSDKLEIMDKCSNIELDSVVFTLKVIFYSFVIIFLIIYINNIINSTGDFRNGLYNSGYFEEQRCYNG